MKVYYSPTNAQMIVLKTVLQFTLKQVRHVSVQSHHLQGAHYPCLLKLHFVKIVSYGSSVYDQISGDVAAYIGRVLVDVCMSHCSGVDCVRYYSQVTELSLIVISTVQEWS